MVMVVVRARCHHFHRVCKSSFIREKKLIKINKHTNGDASRLGPLSICQPCPLHRCGLLLFINIVKKKEKEVYLRAADVTIELLSIPEHAAAPTAVGVTAANFANAVGVVYL